MSNSITCPNCGQKINLDESDYARILSQVSEEELSRRLHEHEKALLAEQESAVLKAEGAVRDEMQEKLAEKDQQLAKLKASLEATKAESEGSLKVAAAEAEKLVAELEAKLDKAEQEAVHAAKALEDEKKFALAEAKSQAEVKLAEKDAKLAALEEQIKALDDARANDVKLAIADAEAKVQELQAQLDLKEQEAQLALTGAKGEADAKLAKKDMDIAKLEASIAGMRERFEVEKKAAVTEEASKQREALTKLEGDIELAKKEKGQIEATLRQQMLELEKYKDQIIRDRDAEIERIRDQKAKLSTKLLGESLEQHCEIEFKKWGPTAFPKADFHKDTKAVEGEDGKATKGDYIFRECDEDGNEIISIMFEMKTEDDQSTNKKTNESHFKKLDEDRRKKNCEYAVLVSALEPESELYTGITDVSWAYEKMYVIRPQFFISMITLLRNAAMTTMAEKRELAKVRQQNIDVTNFETALNAFKDGFASDLKHAENKFEAADDAISKAIKNLEKWREEIRLVRVHLYRADKKIDDISVKKLTKGNPTMKAMFAEAQEEAEKVTPTELPDEGESGVEPDSLE